MTQTNYKHPDYCEEEEKIFLLMHWEESQPSDLRTKVMAELKEEINGTNKKEV